MASKNDFEKRILEARETSWQNFGKKILFYAPSFTYYRNKYFHSSTTSFPSISVTGSHCALNCAHCGGKILETMISAQTPRQLFQICQEAKEKGAVGCLISGGCMGNGRVPIDRFLPIIGEIKRRLGLKIVVHTGFLEKTTVERMKEEGVDTISVDIIGSTETSREVYHLNATIEDYEKTLQVLEDSGIPFTPHVLVGLHHGRILGEINALKMISRHNPSALIIIGFFPIKDTLMHNTRPPSPQDIIRIIIQGRSMMPKTPIILGCARPKGTHRDLTDVLAVEAGINAIAFPSSDAISRAEDLGLETIFFPTCCSLLYLNAGRN